MFDLATRAQPARSDAAAVFGVPFDLRLVQPAPQRAYPYTSFTNATGAPQAGQEVLATYGLELEDRLNTAVILSLFTDRRAGADDALPRGATQRRGWVGEEYVGAGAAGAEPDRWGSGLWLLTGGKVVGELLAAARHAAEEALAWLVRDGIAQAVAVQASWAGAQADRLALRVTITRAGDVAPVYDVLWGTTLRKGTEQ